MQKSETSRVMGVSRSAACLALWCVLLMGCTPTQPQQTLVSTTFLGNPVSISPIVGRFSDGEVVTGASLDNPIEGDYPLRVQSRRSGLACEVTTHAPPVRPTAETCAAQQGTIHFACEDGRKAHTTWRGESCTSGYGVGTDSLGNRFDYSFGMPPAVALAHFDRQQEQETAAIAPALHGLDATVGPPPKPEPNIPEPSIQTPAHPASRFDNLSRHSRLTNGTGFFVTGDGYILTNYHVIEGSDLIGVKFGGVILEAMVQGLDRANDIALLKVEAETRPLPLPTMPEYRRGGEVMTLGFPLSDLNASSQKATFGRINDLSGLRGDTRFLQMDVPVQPGNSGGPLFNTRGEVIGIVTGRTNDIAALELYGTVPQNMNFAIKADYIRPLVRGLRSPTIPTGAPEELSFAALAETYENSVVMIMTWEKRRN